MICDDGADDMVVVAVAVSVAVSSFLVRYNPRPFRSCEEMDTVGASARARPALSASVAPR